MNPWKALYIKELKDNRGVFLFLIAAALALSLYGCVRGLADGGPTPYVALMALPFLSPFVLPLLLMHAFSKEFAGQTHYQLLSLPVPRAAVVLAKFLAVFSLGAVVYATATGTVHLFLLRLQSLSPDHALRRISGGDVWRSTGQVYFAVLLMLMAIASAMAGLRLVVRRFQGLIMTAFFLASLYLYGRTLFWFLHLVHGQQLEAASQLPGVGMVSDLLPRVPSLAVLTVTLVFSLLLLGLGLLLFERYAEA